MHTTNSDTNNTVLILGARGRFGLAAARAFAEAGWRVLGQHRAGKVAPTLVATRTTLPPEGAVVALGRPGGDAAPPPTAGIEWLGINLNDTQALAQAAEGATVVVHALNPAYTNKAWRDEVLPMTDAAIAITRALGATLMVPGNVYNFGAGMPALLRENTPQLARTVKGQIRIAMEQHLQHSGVPSIVIRAGDFFGSGSGTWFDTAMVKEIRKGVFTYPGAPEVPRAWAYLPDLARSFVAVARQRARLPAFEVLHFAGHQITGQRWLDVLAPIAQAQAWGKPGAALKLAQLPWPVIRIGALVVATWAALLEMRYLWQTPHALANDKLTALVGTEPHTPLPQAVQAALVDLGFIQGAHA
ncbi:MAG: NAD-dependent epimerase/dehydratase family protein [Pseudomonadota bacterium]